MFCQCQILFRLKKSQIKPGFFVFKSALKKARISIKIWFQKSQIGNPVLWLIHNMIHSFAWKQVSGMLAER